MAEEVVTSQQLTEWLKSQGTSDDQIRLTISAVANKHVTAEHDTVKKTVGQTKHEKPYIRLTATNAQGRNVLSEGKEDEQNKHFNYGRDLKLRNKIGQQLVAEIEGPDKAIGKAAEKMVAALNQLGVPISLEEAERRIREMGQTQEANA